MLSTGGEVAASREPTSQGSTFRSGNAAGNCVVTEKGSCLHSAPGEPWTCLARAAQVQCLLGFESQLLHLQAV